ncbi:MAG TPA: exodeoxyribonuclease VII small subunit [Candidatus Binatia bacterium]|nr:exodeoxyribonuclease VII small subunit [Candidatus Binatia bacterium]
MSERSDLDGLSFEAGMKELEAIVARLEQGNLPLEDSLQAFEQGVAVLRVLQTRLSEVERRVEILTQAADGALRAREAGPLAK